MALCFRNFSAYMVSGVAEEPGGGALLRRAVSSSGGTEQKEEPAKIHTSQQLPSDLQDSDQVSPPTSMTRDKLITD